MGRDYTIFAKTQGIVTFETKRGRKLISVYPEVEQ
jgi:ribosomal protein L27